MVTEEEIVTEFTHTIDFVYPKVGDLLHHCYVKVLNVYWGQPFKRLRYIGIYCPSQLIPLIKAHQHNLRDAANNMGLAEVVLLNATSLVRDPMSKLKQNSPRLWLELLWIACQEQSDGSQSRKKFSLSPDDLPPAQVTKLDKTLHRLLEASSCKHFYTSCDRITQALLSKCEFSIKINSTSVTLVINCPNAETYWDIVNDIAQIGSKLELLARNSRVRVGLSAMKGMQFEIGVDEISDNSDLLEDE